MQWDAWGNRIDRIEVTPLWQRAAQIAAQAGLIAIPYERAHGRYSRIHQFAAVYLFHPSSDVYTCPLAMTDGAARTLRGVEQRAADRARRAASDQPRSGASMDERPVDDRVDRRLRRGSIADSRRAR